MDVLVLLALVSIIVLCIVGPIIYMLVYFGTMFAKYLIDTIKWNIDMFKNKF